MFCLPIIKTNLLKTKENPKKQDHGRICLVNLHKSSARDRELIHRSIFPWFIKTRAQKTKTENPAPFDVSFWNNLKHGLKYFLRNPFVRLQINVLCLCTGLPI